MYYQQFAKEHWNGVDVTAEFYSFPQKYVLELILSLNPWTCGKQQRQMIQFDKDLDGDRPTVGQFTQPSMSPFTEQLRTCAPLLPAKQA